jgi:hypothetical protein
VLLLENIVYVYKVLFVGFEVLMTVTVMSTIFRDGLPLSFLSLNCVVMIEQVRLITVTSLW